MMMAYVRRLLLAWIALALLCLLFGRVSIAASNGGQTGADFLNIGVGARAAGFGGAYSSVAEGALASYWNPAGLASLSTGEILFSHFSWYREIRVNHGAAAYRLGERISGAVSLTYLSYGDISGFDANGSLTEVAAYDWAGAVSFGMDMTGGMSVGFTGKIVNQRVDDLNAATFAVDLGLSYRRPGLAVSLVAANIGPDLDFDGVREQLPATVRLGLATFLLDNSLIVAMEMDHKAAGSSFIRQGAEYRFSEKYFIRGGVNFRSQSDDALSRRTSFTFGTGVRFQDLTVDYAFTPGSSGSLSDEIHRFSFTYHLSR